jgi:hypothetical protein
LSIQLLKPHQVKTSKQTLKAVFYVLSLFVVSTCQHPINPVTKSRSTITSHANPSKAIPVTGRAGLQGYETSRLPHYLDSRLTDGGKVVSLTRRPPFTPQEDSWYSFLLEAELTPGPQCDWKD